MLLVAGTQHEQVAGPPLDVEHSEDVVELERGTEEPFLLYYLIVTSSDLSAPLLQRPPPTSSLQKLADRRIGTLTRIQTGKLPNSPIPFDPSQVAVCPGRLR